MIIRSQNLILLIFVAEHFIYITFVFLNKGFKIIIIFLSIYYPLNTFKSIYY